MVRRLGLGKNNHLTYASLALNPRNVNEKYEMTQISLSSQKSDQSLLFT